MESKDEGTLASLAVQKQSNFSNTINCGKWIQYLSFAGYGSSIFILIRVYSWGTTPCNREIYI